MVGLAIEMTRSTRSLEQITRLYAACFQPDRKVPGIPMVPGLGLYLDELFFEKYNLKLKYESEKREKAALNKQKRAEGSASADQEEEKEDTSISVSPPFLPR
jgi:tRNA U38,U39,U40 pseudouridine synthase TruA